jgi:hypothetical protein
MGFDWQKIPSIRNAFQIKHYPICDFSYEDIEILSSSASFNKKLYQIYPEDCFHFEPRFGWKDHIEL